MSVRLSKAKILEVEGIPSPKSASEVKFGGRSVGEGLDTHGALGVLGKAAFFAGVAVAVIVAEAAVGAVNDALGTLTFVVH